MNVSELRPLDDASLQKQLDDLERQLFDLRFQRAAGQLQNHNRLGELRRDIARVKTLLRQRAATTEGKAK